jgi:hypothetical protein
MKIRVFRHTLGFWGVIFIPSKRILLGISSAGSVFAEKASRPLGGRHKRWFVEVSFSSVQLPEQTFPKIEQLLAKEKQLKKLEQEVQELRHSLYSVVSNILK